MLRPVRVLALLLLCVSGIAAVSARAANESFPMPAAIAPRVEFWTRVYSEVGTNGGFIHDSEDLSLVYEVVSVPPGASDGTLEREVDRAKGRVAAALRKLAAGQRSGLGKTESRVLAQFPPNVASRTLAAAADRVRFQRGQANKFKAGLERMGRWESHVRRALRERGVPEDLKALPHVESSYNPDAHSHAGASGLWQFTRPTGRLYMRVDHIVDERRDPFVASEAAARLLRSNYERLGSWPLGITAYNHGPGGLARAVRNLGTRDIGVIVARHRSPSFGFASKNFYSEFLAARRIDQNPERYFGPILKEAPYDHESVVLRRSYGASALARALSLSTAELRDWNPALLGPVWNGSRNVPAAYELRVPRRGSHPAASSLVAGIQGDGYQGLADGTPAARTASASASRAQVAATGSHKVKKGETLGAIAARYGTSSEEIMALNGIRNAKRVRAGQVLEIPGSAILEAPVAPAEPVRVAAPEPAPAPAAEPQLGARAPISDAAVATIHRVAAGETLIEIARKYEVSMARIAARNGIRDPRDLREGQTLEIPPPDRGNALPEPAPSSVQPSTVAAVLPAPAEPAAAEPAPPEPAAKPIETTEAAPPEPAPEPAAEPAHEAPAATLDPEPAAAPRTHTVARGDTLGSIARANGMSPQALAAANGIDDPRRIKAGQVLTIPEDGAAPAPVRSASAAKPTSERAPKSKPAAPAARYVVKKGDTLQSIARARGTTPKALASANGIRDPHSIRPGQKLTIPGAAGPAASPASAPAETQVANALPPYSGPPLAVYTVRPGDTLYSIASRHGLRVADIVRVNGLRTQKLSVGQRLRLPPGEES
jgi:membrane-bound lytic murein transglycosylase D